MHVSDLDDQWLLRTHFFGIYKKDDDGTLYLENPSVVGDRLPVSVMTDAIAAAIERLEGNINARIKAVEDRLEYQHFDRDLFNSYNYVVLDYYPVKEVSSFRFVYGESGGQVWNIPSDIIQLNNAKFGTVQILPFRSLQLTESYDPGLLPFSANVFSGYKVPSILELTYTSGMDSFDSGLPWSIVRAIGMLASKAIFDIFGDIVIGAGIASISTSIDGLSQSVNTTASAENSAFSSRILSYNEELYGKDKYPGLMEAIKAEWRRIPLGVFP